MVKNKTEHGRWEMLGVGKVCLILSGVVKVGLSFLQLYCWAYVWA